MNSADVIIKLVPAGWVEDGRQVYKTVDGSITVRASTYRARNHRNHDRRTTYTQWRAHETKAPYRELATAFTLKALMPRLLKALTGPTALATPDEDEVRG